MSDWDWDQEQENGDVIVPRVDAIAVYMNTKGSIVIRQQDSMGGDDSVVAIPKMYAQAVIDKILYWMKQEPADE